MNKLILSVVFFIASINGYSQNTTELGVFGGISNYQGDLVDKVYMSRFTKAAAGVMLSRSITDRISLRGGLTYTKVTGDDRYNTKTYLQARNLSFTTSITELSLVGEVHTFSMVQKRWSPYLFGGLALFHFNPYAFDEIGAKVYLRPLSTEGQGLAQYPDRKPYSKTQVAIPFGGGIKYYLTDNIRLGFEIGLRRLFTDYLDDLSTNYVDEADLLAERGPLAVAYAFRGDEVDPSLTYPAKGDQRGGATQKDYYYLTGLTVSFRLGSGSGYRGFANKSRLNCPKVPL